MSLSRFVVPFARQTMTQEALLRRSSERRSTGLTGADSRALRIYSRAWACGKSLSLHCFFAATPQRKAGRGVVHSRLTVSRDGTSTRCARASGEGRAHDARWQCSEAFKRSDAFHAYLCKTTYINQAHPSPHSARGDRPRSQTCHRRPRDIRR